MDTIKKTVRRVSEAKLTLPIRRVANKHTSVVPDSAMSGKLNVANEIKFTEDEENSVESAVIDIEETPNLVKQLFVWIFGYLDTRAWTIVAVIMTLYILFAEDFRLAFLPKSVDLGFSIIALIIFVVFTLELIIFSVAQAKYFGGFYFWVDVVATLSIITEIVFIWEPLLNLLVSGSGSSQTALNAVGTTRLGTKVARIARTVRTVRAVRLLQLRPKRDKNEDPDDPSFIGDKLHEMNTKRIVQIVLLLLLSSILFDATTYDTHPVDGTTAVYIIERQISAGFTVYPAENDFLDFLNTTIQPQIQDLTLGLEGQELIFLEFYNLTQLQSEYILSFARNTMFMNDDTGQFQDTNPVNGYDPSDAVLSSRDQVLEEYRELSIEIADVLTCFDNSVLPPLPLPDSEERCFSAAYFSLNNEIRFESLLGIGETLFLLLLLMGYAALLRRDAARLIIQPLEKLMDYVKKLAKDPMSYSLTEESSTEKTVILQQTICKISNLLRLGFGEAGGAIIAKNLSAEGTVQRMADGLKVNAVFGFCDIRNFTDTTECLQEKVLKYVNKVGSIVHSATHEWHGAANKNIGDAFLLVWKFPNRKLVQALGTFSNVNLCNSALVAFLRTQIDLHWENSPGGSMYEYKLYPSIRDRFGTDFEIRLGMGLHVGWAIEGPIGSNYKIDASYLSPNVNIASRLEAATKQFRTPILLSEAFFNELSESAQKRCRQIDRVTLKGSVNPMRLFACDILQFPRAFGKPAYDADGDRLPFDFNGPLMSKAQEGLESTFLQRFNFAVDKYLFGDWQESKEALEKLLEEKENDGPAISLLEAMETFDFKAPCDWPGYRILTEK